MGGSARGCAMGLWRGKAETERQQQGGGRRQGHGTCGHGWTGSGEETDSSPGCRSNGRRVVGVPVILAAAMSDQQQTWWWWRSEAVVPELVVEVVDERHARGQVQLHDLTV